jgi:preprotein translocase subunit SecY
VLAIATIMTTMVAGTAVIMWMGELVTDRGVGNGMSVLVFTSVIAVIPGQLAHIYLTRGIPLTLAGLPQPGEPPAGKIAGTAGRRAALTMS